MSDHTPDVLFNVFEDWNEKYVPAVHKLSRWNTYRDHLTVLVRVKC